MLYEFNPVNYSLYWSISEKRSEVVMELSFDPCYQIRISKEKFPREGGERRKGDHSFEMRLFKINIEEEE
ncbi:MAG: hypothetical protein ACE5K4_11080 [Candidatus Hydrothermarchaeota archaeon]